MPSRRHYTLTASCPDQVGIIARVAGFIAQHGGWILESSYHADQGDEESGAAARYFMRMEVKAESLPFHLAEFRERFRLLADDLSMTWQISDSAVKRRVVILVSKQEHCLYDLLARWQSREAVRKMAALRGWQVQRLKIDDGCYELRGVDAEGRAFKARIDPETLEVLRMQNRARDGDGHRKRERGDPGAHGAAPANESFPAGASS